MLNLKLDELIRAVNNASNQMIDLDALTDEQLLQLEEKSRKLAETDN